jgi:hypothetical protein
VGVVETDADSLSTAFPHELGDLLEEVLFSPKQLVAGHLGLRPFDVAKVSNEISLPLADETGAVRAGEPG